MKAHKILIVDDEELIRRSLKRMLSSAGYEVFEAQDGVQGLDLWQKERPHLVILDVLMPGLTGPQVLKRLSPELRCKVILISAYTGEYDLKKAQDVGADLFVSKPFQNIFEVLEMAKRMLPQ